MDRERLDSLNDETAAESAAIDRELRDALAITPSAGFNARLRERLALERGSRVWPRWTLLAMASGAMAAIVLAVALMRPPARDVRPPVSPLPQIAAPSQAPMSAVGGPQPTDRTTTARAATSMAASRPATQLRDVEVIVPSGQNAALKRFADDLNDSVVSGRWVPALAGGAPNSGFYVLPTAPTIDQLPAALSYDSIKKE